LDVGRSTLTIRKRKERRSMGYYIQGPARGKAQFIVENYGGKIVTREVAEQALSSHDEAPIVVLDNGPFEAAGFAFCQGEWEEFVEPTDPRKKVFVVMPRSLAKKLSGFNR
jgi:hypothetical protein